MGWSGGQRGSGAKGSGTAKGGRSGARAGGVLAEGRNRASGAPRAGRDGSSDWRGPEGQPEVADVGKAAGEKQDAGIYG